MTEKDDTEYVDADFTDEPTPADVFSEDIDPGEPTLELLDQTAFDTHLQIFGHDTNSEERAHLCCSECGERIELVSGEFGGVAGGVCGCRETPVEWTAETLDADK